MTGKLYVVGTPIGNFDDFSPRAVHILKNVDFIAAEDPKVTENLLKKFQINTPMINYHKYNCTEHTDEVLCHLKNGADCAIVSDAGMPCISDPGEVLIKDCADAGIEICAVPGPTAAITAAAISGLPCGRFTFEGFLSVNKNSRYRHLHSLKNEFRTMVFYESPKKLSYTLHDMYTVFGDRKISIVIDLTKPDEKVIRTTLSEAIEKFCDFTFKGELVLVIEGKTGQDNNIF